MPLFPAMKHERILASLPDADTSLELFGEQPLDNELTQSMARFELVFPEGGLSGLVDGDALFDFDGYLQRSDQRVEALGRIADLDLPAGDGAIATDSNGISVPLAWLLDHAGDSHGRNDVSIPQSQEGVAGTNADAPIHSAAGLAGLVDDEAPLDFSAYLDISEQSISALGRISGLALQADDGAAITAQGEYALQLSLLFEQIDHSTAQIDLATGLDHTASDLPTAAEMTGMDWMSPAVVDTFGFDYSLF
tara:strand:- start:860 stop:1609 length:750 start_codon:yes stop_codon:yes gene_type:complete